MAVLAFLEKDIPFAGSFLLGFADLLRVRENVGLTMRRSGGSEVFLIRDPTLILLLES